MLSCEFYDIIQKSYFAEHPPTVSSTLRKFEHEPWNALYSHTRTHMLLSLMAGVPIS